MIRAAAILTVVASLSLAAQRPSFKVQTDLVRIDVLVERGGRPVTGLSAADFVVEDNGVPQRVSLLPGTGDVTVSAVLDVSGSMTPENLRNADSGVRAIIGAMRTDDRFDLFALTGDVRYVPLTIRPEAFSSESIVVGLRHASGLHTSLFDALFAAIVRNDAAGPRVVIVLTDGHDNSSWVSAQDAIDSAVRHEAVIYPVAIGEAVQVSLKAVPLGGNPSERLLQLLASRTGGRVVRADWSRDLAPVFEAIVREYRQRYILTFVPEGVRRGDGWHRLEVKLRSQSGRVHARSGYMAR